MKKPVYFFLAIAFGIAMALIAPYSISSPKVDAVEVQSKPAVTEKTETLRDELRFVCSCESTGKPYNEPQHYDKNGAVLLGKINKRDTGLCQINTRYWLDLANKLGYDIFTPQGNIKMANYIYDKQGLTPWGASRSCWGSAVSNMR